jgi:molybdenum cofactor cytidylyltransferase
MNLGVIILAAGRSGRMGQPKLLLPWRGRTVLAHLIELWTELRAWQVGVVYSKATPEVERELERAGGPDAFRIENPIADGDMWSSIHAAARWRGWSCSLTHFAVVLGDQPHISAVTLQKFLERIDVGVTAAWVPEVCGEHCHPVVLHKECWEKLARSTAQTLRDFLHSGECELRTVKINDPALMRDMDTPEDFEELRPQG